MTESAKIEPDPPQLVVAINGWRPSARHFGLNSRAHWSVRARANREAKRLITAALNLARKRPGLILTGGLEISLAIVTAQRSGRLPDGDNLQGMLKPVRDAVAAWIGRDDGDASLRWLYGVRRGPVDAVEISIR